MYISGIILIFAAYRKLEDMSKREIVHPPSHSATYNCFCQVKCRGGKGYGNRFEIEQRVAEQYAKSVGMWIVHFAFFDYIYMFAKKYECEQF